MKVIDLIKNYQGNLFIDDVLQFFDDDSKYDELLGDVYGAFLNEAIERATPTMVFTEDEEEKCQQFLSQMSARRSAILCFCLKRGSVRLYAFPSKNILDYKLAHNSSYQKLKEIKSQIEESGKDL